MRQRALLAVFLIGIAIRCVPGRVGIVDVGSIVPPMPLKTTPEGYDAAPRPSFTETPRATPTPTPTPPGNLEPIVEPIPDRLVIR